MLKSCARTLSAVCFLTLCLSAFAAEPAKPVPLQTRLKRVALFKNGLGFLVREATLTGDTDVTLLGPFAAPSHGTFWVSCPATAGLRSVVAAEASYKEPLEARELAELLRANVGNTATVYLTPDRPIAGKILSFAPDRSHEPPGLYIMGGAPQYERTQIVPPGRGQFVLLETDDGIVALDPYRIDRVHFPDAAPSTSFLVEAKRVELRAALDNPGRGDWLSVSYLAKGLTWAPSYLIDISDPKQARLAAQALVINEAEDFEDIHVDLITGFPNLQFADILSPIGKKEGLAAFLQSLARGRSRAEQRGVMTQAAVYAPVAEYEAAARRVLPLGDPRLHQ
jgi:hypothetical protein